MPHLVQSHLNLICLPALARFSESILDYVANVENAPDPTVTKEAFSNQIYSAFDICFNVWLQSKEAKVRNLHLHNAN